ncbi:complex I subunit 5 family protein [Thermohalobacter berrensis]|uniref:NADH:quinone oxidoreductase/Mrp antiporter transmembrane domain-containing protein n=1 Tax=Thermohalobacter berrensis TaxID=99594 RepID=A0A419SZK3_9FIRM|nr:proton-conducting transporter membrane subunit [Thermohalobacter berrensis]RKD30581.1 hypothetical protein BET03_04385 [Thermohalobacter berrensis]
MEFIPVYIIFIPIIASMIVYLFNNKYISYLALVSQILITIIFIPYFNFLKEHGIHELYIGGWNKAIGIALKNDMLSLAFICLSIIIWWLILIYFWDRRKVDYKFLFFFLFLEGVFLGLLQTNDLFNFFVFVEATTIISAILIIYKKDGYSIRAGFYYLLFNSVGMIFYLIGLILVYIVVGTLNMDVISNTIILIKDTNIVKMAYIFMIVAMGVKAAFFPVYNWLPKAHGAAPASISALLSGLLVKSGLYGFIRIGQIFQFNYFNEFFFLIGFFTAFSGVLFAISQKDIKQILAFHTISQIGIVLMGLSSMSGNLYYGGLLHLFNHAFFKSLLFLGAGLIINEYKVRRVTEIRGVFKNFPFMSIYMIVGILSITGAPLFNGFVSKSIIEYELKNSFIKVIMLNIVNLGTIISFVKFSQIFFGNSDVKINKHINRTFSIFLLALMCIIIGNFYNPIASHLLNIDLPYVCHLDIIKWVKYIVNLAIGYVIYKKVIDRDYCLIKKIRHTKISFQTSNLMLLFFIFTMIIWSSILV